MRIWLLPCLVIVGLTACMGSASNDDNSQGQDVLTTESRTQAVGVTPIPSPTPCPTCPEPTPCPEQAPCPICPEPIVCSACPTCPTCPESVVCPEPVVCPQDTPCPAYPTCPAVTQADCSACQSLVDEWRSAAYETQDLFESCVNEQIPSCVPGFEIYDPMLGTCIPTYYYCDYHCD